MSVELVVGLLRHVGSLDTRIALERSFKMVHGRLFEDRILLGVDRGSAGLLDDAIASICVKIGMPRDFLSTFKQALADANHVYFGAENDDTSLIFKAYLEFRDKAELEIAGAPVTGRSYDLFTGFKWDARSPSRQALTRYVWHPFLPPAGMLQRVRSIIDPLAHDLLYGVVSEVAERVAASVQPEEIQYLEVTEEGNPRTSFDINVYKAGHRVQDVHTLLLRAMQHYAFPPAQLHSLFERIRTERLGHLAGGVDRHGREFMILYYGVNHLDGKRLGSAVVAQVRG